jgi:bifunctional DNase/RNase
MRGARLALLTWDAGEVLEVIEMSIESVRVSMQNLNRVVILREKESERYLVIWIGPAEAEAIAMRLGDVSPPRPQTHDLLRNLIESLGGVVTHVLVNDIQNDTYFARIAVQTDGRTVEIDSRPSDAIALAVRAGVPVYVEESVLERAGILLDKEAQEAGEEALATANNEPVSRTNPEEIEKMSAFRDFIESLDLDDFEKRKQD